MSLEAEQSHSLSVTEGSSIATKWNFIQSQTLALRPTAPETGLGHSAPHPELLGAGQCWSLAGSQSCSLLTALGLGQQQLWPGLSQCWGLGSVPQSPS